MKEQDIDKLIKKSRVNTSDDFTDRLIQNIEYKSEMNSTHIWSFKMVLRSIVTLMIIICGLLYVLLKDAYPIFDIEIHISKSFVFLISLIAFLFCVNYLLRLNTTYRSILKS